MCELLDALIGADRTAEALAIWDSASQRGLRARQRTLTKLMAAANEPAQAVANPMLASRLYDARLFGDGITGELQMIHALGMTGKLQEALEVFRRTMATFEANPSFGSLASCGGDGEDFRGDNVRLRRGSAHECTQTEEQLATEAEQLVWGAKHRDDGMNEAARTLSDDASMSQQLRSRENKANRSISKERRQHESQVRQVSSCWRGAQLMLEYAS